MTQSLMFWKQRPTLLNSPAAIAQELNFGEEVEGLIDLPVREFLDRIKAEFPQVDERPGLLVSRGQGEVFEVSWSWQVVKVQASDLDEDARERLVAIGQEFGCQAYET